MAALPARASGASRGALRLMRRRQKDARPHARLSAYERHDRRRPQGGAQSRPRLRRGRAAAGLGQGPGNFVSAADHKAEDIIFRELSKARPGYGFLMEERGEVDGDDKTHRWIVDPLDGTTNFLHGMPLFAISIGLEREGQIVAGVVYNPISDELFTAEKGKGAFLNDRRRLRVAARKNLGDAVVATGIPHRGRPGHVRFLREMQGGDASRSPASAAPALPRSTSPGSPPAASTATGSAASSRGTWRPASCSCARRAASSPTYRAVRRCSTRLKCLPPTARCKRQLSWPMPGRLAPEGACAGHDVARFVLSLASGNVTWLK